jgi:small subunit ribosomal protein S1
VGQKVTGVVTNITDFGLFVEVEEGIEGLVHVSEISRKKIKSPSEMYKEGDTIEAKVIHVSADERRLGLSIKQTKEEPARAAGGGKSKSFGGDSVSAGSTLGDLLREKLEEAAGDALAAAEEEAEAAVEETPETEAPAEEEESK